MEAAWQGADLFALATEWEGHAAAVAEALRRGLPVAVTRGGAAAELVPPEAGVACDAGDVDGLSKALRRLIFDAGLRADMAEAAWRAGQALPDMARPGATVRGGGMLLGCIADDFTGATDLASTLVRGGMRTVQLIGVPSGPPPEADAVVVALKSRTTPAGDAVRESLAALRWLRGGRLPAGVPEILLHLRQHRRRQHRPGRRRADRAPWAVASRSPARPSRPTRARCSRAISSWAGRC